MPRKPTKHPPPKEPMDTSPPLASPEPEQVSLIIAGYTFQLIVPYAPGQPLGVAEASILNREWTQAVRAAFQAQVEGAIATLGGGLTNAALASLQLDFQHFADQFAFRALSQSPKNADPLTRQKHTIAKRILDIRLNGLGWTRQTYGENKYQAAIARLMNNPQVVQQAQAQLASARAAADDLAGLTQEDLTDG